MTAVKNENLMKSAISGLAAHDSRKLEKIFEKEGFYGKEQDKAQETEEE